MDTFDTFDIFICSMYVVLLVIGLDLICAGVRDRTRDDRENFRGGGGGGGRGGGGGFRGGGAFDGRGYGGFGRSNVNFANIDNTAEYSVGSDGGWGENYPYYPYTYEQLPYEYEYEE